MSKRLVQKLNGVSDTGQRYVIQIYQTLIDTSDMRSGHSEKLGGLKEAFTSDGRALNFVDEKTFRFVDSNEAIHGV
jgi:hypothetical protein